MRSILVFIGCSFFAISIWGQNLIRNGSFEEVVCPDNTIASFYESEHWNATGADAYWMHYSCEIDPSDTQSIIAINSNIVPYVGSGYISLEGVIFKNGMVISEGVSQQLLKPLNEGSFYYFEVGSLKYDVENPFEIIPEECSLFPDRGLELRLDHQHIMFDLDSETVNFEPIVHGFETTSKLIVDDIHIDDTPSSAYNWVNYWTCFEAEEAFDHLAITGPNKLMTELNNCMEEGLEGIQHLSGYAIDYIQLHEIPEKLDTVLFLCNGGVDFQLESLLTGPFVDKAIIGWEDGVSGANRSFSEAGEFLLTLELDCTQVQISVNVIDENCDVKVVVPNVFALSESGANSQIKPILISDFVIEAYTWSIYDRWGNLMFSTENVEDFWDGTVNGKPVQQGVYIWKLNYSINNEAVKEYAFGTITLLR
ncbi:MAG: gliding motility-associated C-terminal domain-containing protein [Saprospiraceae bacterium]|nr:gliding motility-associated C-terminal domain-containing protein [Saprospiraceae bacterium]